VLSVLAVVLFMMLSNPFYWSRIGTITLAGEQVEGVDTGSGRLVLINAQLEMFQAYPFGCGHRCTAVLSRSYLDDSMLTGQGEDRARSSHSTYLTMLVEHGVVGVLLHLALLLWIVSALRRLKRHCADREGFLPTLLPAVAGAMGAIAVGDLFVDYLRMEVRLWFVATLMVMLNLAAAEERAGAVAAAPHRERVNRGGDARQGRARRPSNAETDAVTRRVAEESKRGRRQ
jgi:hypothetical protein